LDEVSLNGSDFRISNAKQSQNKINLTFELPQRKHKNDMRLFILGQEIELWDPVVACE
jgi:hypothetical protein